MRELALNRVCGRAWLLGDGCLGASLRGNHMLARNGAQRLRRTEQMTDATKTDVLRRTAPCETSSAATASKKPRRISTYVILHKHNYAETGHPAGTRSLHSYLIRNLAYFQNQYGRN